jgi:hypothetical protein
MRRIALAGDYAAVWIVEADTIPPHDALEKLLETQQDSGAEIVTGLYVLRHGANVPNLFSCKDAGRNLGSALTWQEIKDARDVVIRVSGGCMGCVLVQPSALDFDFENITLNANGNPRAPDMDWMRHNWQAGRITLARLDVLCGHKEPSGDVLRPEEFLR